MRLTIIGCSGSFAGPDSPASCYLVQATDEAGRVWSIVLDLGNGALGPLQRHIGLNEVDAVLLTHLHPDHCADMSGLYVNWMYHPKLTFDRRLPVWGPRGTAERIALAYHGIDESGMSAEFDIRELSDGACLSVGPLSVTAVKVRHPVLAFGFRVEADGAVLAYSGDTDSTPALTALLTGADLALMDSAFIDGRDDANVGIHLSGSRAARACLDAGGVKRLMLTHIPAWNDPQVCRQQAAAVWPGEVELAQPEMVYDLVKMTSEPVARVIET